MHPRTCLCALLLTTFACGDTPADNDSGEGGGSSSGGASEGEPTSGSEPPGIAELAACDESDLQPIGWMGPAFDPETGKLLAPLEAPYIVATTVGWHTPENSEALESHTTPVAMDIFNHAGLIAVNLALSPRCGSARTLSVWRDEASLMMFVLGKVHSAAISGGLKYTLGWETTHWTETAADAPPSWELARQRLAEAR